jgi:hypothetical protein
VLYPQAKSKHESCKYRAFLWHASNIDSHTYIIFWLAQFALRPFDFPCLIHYRHYHNTEADLQTEVSVMESDCIC